MRLAADLASAFFYIFDTPWYDRGWGKDDVTLRIGDRKHQSSHTSAFLERYFPDEKDPSGAFDQDPQDALIRLCICLEELCFGRPFETLDAYTKLCDEHGQPQPHTHRTAAWELITEVEYELAGDYCEAVRNCLINALRINSSHNADQEVWQQAYDEIVKPLQKMTACVS